MEFCFTSQQSSVFEKLDSWLEGLNTPRMDRIITHSPTCIT